ncbi:MAG: hypothetical protein F9K29_23725 [Hyphomicrobiaceae bacterium]|nr:MAG: hypothetical protein F9K29_23725 [Hyphomicrobiaceae bacterium]
MRAGARPASPASPLRPGRHGGSALRRGELLKPRGQRLLAVLRQARLQAIAFIALLLGLLLIAGGTAAVAQPKFPPLTGRVVDEVGLLAADSRRALERDLEALETKSTDQLVVYITRSLQGYPIEDFGYRLGRHWQIGQKDKNNGVLLIVAPNERKVRIEVGRGLEPQLTDILTKLIIENAILPAFRRNDFPGGIMAGVRDIRDVLLGDAEAVKERARSAKKRTTGGGNAMAVAVLVLFILIAVSVVWAQSMQTAHPGRAMRSRRDARRQGDSIIPSTWGSSSGGWSSGGSSDSGGGFSGGGGDFGGGGSSGSW